MSGDLHSPFWNNSNPIKAQKYNRKTSKPENRLNYFLHWSPIGAPLEPEDLIVWNPFGWSVDLYLFQPEVLIWRESRKPSVLPRCLTRHLLSNLNMGSFMKGGLTLWCPRAGSGWAGGKSLRHLNIDVVGPMRVAFSSRHDQISRQMNKLQ